MKYFICLFLILFCGLNSYALWEENSPTPTNGLYNPYNLSIFEFEKQIRNGRLHALNYPVTISGLLLPYHPIKKALDSDSSNPLRRFMYKIIKGVSKVKSFEDMNDWLGLNRYPEEEGTGAYYIPKKNNLETNHMGFSMMDINGTKGFTHSCAACHTSDLFGKKVMGLTNRFSKANEYFIMGKKSFKFINRVNFYALTSANKEELDLISRTKKNLKFVEANKPSHLGLDTSLAHVALSLSHRSKDEYATKRKRNAYFPRKDKLRNYVADSKPGVWWTVKYKNKWLLDGSVVSGNPILTNILWNEIGRGTDLKELESWMENNQDIIEELTTAVFSTTAPHMTDFFSEEYFDLNKAIQGKEVYNKGQCYNCHGHYKKAWEVGEKNWPEVFHTIEVRYPEQTLIKNVGTDPQRYLGMQSLLQLNDLAISKKYGVKVKLQKGYVPPPLEGIWARWPYLHNNSIPNLCALMTPPEKRPKTYYSGAPKNKDTDFSFNCNGYPLGDLTPTSWKTKLHLFDTKKPGMSNQGHYKMFLNEDGSEKFTQKEKSALIHYLQTL